MQAASRESYQAARAAIGAVTIEEGEQILAFAGLLAREPRLRRALSDPSRSVEDKVALVRGLLEGKVGEGALSPTLTLVSGRWSSPSELLDAGERLGVDALLSSAEASGDSADGVATSGDLAEVEDELFRFGQIVSGDPQLAAVIGDASVDQARRVILVRELLEGKAKPVTVKLAEQAVRGFGGRSFGSALTRLVEAAAERRESQIAYVTAAEPLTEAEENRLAASLAAQYGRQVSLKVTVDPNVLGGLSVRVGADLYDGTVARRLATVRNALVAK